MLKPELAISSLPPFSYNIMTIYLSSLLLLISQKEMTWLLVLYMPHFHLWLLLWCRVGLLTIGGFKTWDVCQQIEPSETWKNLPWIPIGWLSELNQSIDQWKEVETCKNFPMFSALVKSPGPADGAKIPQLRLWVCAHSQTLGSDVRKKEWRLLFWIWARGTPTLGPVL